VLGGRTHCIPTNTRTHHSWPSFLVPVPQAKAASFEKEVITRASVAAAPLAMWVKVRPRCCEPPTPAPFPRLRVLSELRLSKHPPPPIHTHPCICPFESAVYL
jgi:hypothetical protein